MLIAIDGACKRNGQPTCSSVGVAWIQTETGELLFKSRFETQSTSQRGEINGLLEALLYAIQHSAPDEDIIIITDSEYLNNTVSKEWYKKWRDNNWVGSSGPVKNAEMWSVIAALLDKLDDRVFMQWTKGHLMAYTPGNIKAAMIADPTGVELLSRISSIATREFEATRIANEFNRERVKHDYTTVDNETAVSWVIANTLADCIASYVVKVMDELVV